MDRRSHRCLATIGSVLLVSVSVWSLPARAGEGASPGGVDRGWGVENTWSAPIGAVPEDLIDLFSTSIARVPAQFGSNGDVNADERVDARDVQFVVNRVIDREYLIRVEQSGPGTVKPKKRLALESESVCFGVTPQVDPEHRAIIRGCGGTFNGGTYCTAPIIGACQVSVTFVPASDLIAGRYLPKGPDQATILDIMTGLEWDRCSVGQRWNVEMERCDGAAESFPWRIAAWLGAAEGFRAPRVEELRSLVHCSTGVPMLFDMRDPNRVCKGDYRRPTILEAAFPDTPSGAYWTASTDSKNGSFAWYVDFDSGLVQGKLKMFDGNLYHMRLVRIP